MWGTPGRRVDIETQSRWSRIAMAVESWRMATDENAMRPFGQVEDVLVFQMPTIAQTMSLSG
jgi:hypothetical protein